MTLYPVNQDQVSDDGSRAIGLFKGKFTDGLPESNIAPSRLSSQTINLILDLLSKTIENANGSSNNTDSTQLFNAINTLAVTRFSEEYTKNKAKQEDFNANNDTKYITSKLLRANNSGTQIGQLGEFIQDKNNLPSGWYLCDGRPFANGTPQFSVLDSLPSSIKTNWKIQRTGDPGNRYLPDFYFRKTGDKRNGFGLFTRQGKEGGSNLGKVEEDTFQGFKFGATGGGVGQGNFDKGTLKYNTGGMGDTSSGIGYYFSAGVAIANDDGPAGDSWRKAEILEDANGTPRTGNETKPMSIGVSKALFLGV